MKTKDDQLKEITVWLDERKIKNLANLNVLDTQKINAQTVLTDENNLIDDIKNII